MRKGSGLIVGGVAVLVVGIMLVAILGGQASACGSTLGGIGSALTNSVAAHCSFVRVFYYVGWAGLVIGSVCAAAGAIQLSSSPHQPLPPGWYEYRRDRWRYWDGNQWHEDPRRRH